MTKHIRKIENSTSEYECNEIAYKNKQVITMEELYTLISETCMKFDGINVKVEGLDNYCNKKIELTCSSEQYMLSLAVVENNVCDLMILKIEDESLIKNITQECDNNHALQEFVIDSIYEFAKLAEDSY